MNRSFFVIRLFRKALKVDVGGAGTACREPGRVKRLEKVCGGLVRDLLGGEFEDVTRVIEDAGKLLAVFGIGEVTRGISVLDLGIVTVDRLIARRHNEEYVNVGVVAAVCGGGQTADRDLGAEIRKVLCGGSVGNHTVILADGIVRVEGKECVIYSLIVGVLGLLLLFSLARGADHDVAVTPFGIRADNLAGMTLEDDVEFLAVEQVGELKGTY